MPHLLYIGQTPDEGTGSPVIVLRHLQRLAAAGWQISVIAETGQDNTLCIREKWTLRTLPLRRWWWPPLRKNRPALSTLRTWLLAGECHRLTSANRPDAVLGYLAAHDDFYTEIAARYARRSGVPLSLLVHDDATAFIPDPIDKIRVRRRHIWMLRQAYRCWFVSPELASTYGLTSKAHGVLPPIPAGHQPFVDWQASFIESTRIYYAGFIWPIQFPLLRKVAHTLANAGATLVLLTRETPPLKEFLNATPIVHHPLFPTNHEALKHLEQEASGILIAYAGTVDEMPWIATSFPSKLVEYVQLGLPCAIVAPHDSAVGLWAKRAGYVDFFTPDEQPRLAAWARDLRNEAAWKRRSEIARTLAREEFSPERIQTAFAAGLLRS